MYLDIEPAMIKSKYYLYYYGFSLMNSWTPEYPLIRPLIVSLHSHLIHLPSS